METIERNITEQQTTTVCMGFSIDGDCRFLSHRDTMRILELAIFRADIDVYFSGGFNPSPKISLPLPRPVGMASEDELLVLRINGLPDKDTLIQIPERINAQCPDEIAFAGEAEILDKKTIEISSATHKTYLKGIANAEQTKANIEKLLSLGTWHAQRKVKGSGRGRSPAKQKTLDIKPMVPLVKVNSDNELEFTLECIDSRWAKPAELFTLLEIEPRMALSQTRRISVTRK